MVKNKNDRSVSFSIKEDDITEVDNIEKSIEKKSSKVTVTAVPGDPVRDPYQGKGGSYTIDENGNRIPVTN